MEENNDNFITEGNDYIENQLKKIQEDIKNIRQ